MKEIYRWVHKHPDHLFELVFGPEFDMWMGCSCGYKDLWASNEPQRLIVKRFNNHITNSDSTRKVDN